MKIFLFTYTLFKKFPFLMSLNLALLFLVNLLNVGSLFTVGPLVDFVVHPDLQNISPLTQKAIDIITFLSIPVTINSWVIIIILLITLASVLQIASEYLIQKTRYRMLQVIVQESLDCLYNAKWQFYVNQKQGELFNSFSRELNVVGGALGGISLFMVNMVQILFMITVPFMISWQVTMICFASIVVFAIPFVICGKCGYAYGKISTASSKRFFALLNENFNLIKVVLGFGNQERSTQDINYAYGVFTRIMVKWRTIGNALFLLYRPVSVLVVAIALHFSRVFEVPVSEITVIIFGLFSVAKTAGMTMQYKNSLENFFPSYEHILELQDKAKAFRQFSGNKAFNALQSGIKVCRLSFAYQEGQSVLNNIDMEIAKGQMVALVGKSGSGKSTLIDLLMGFHEPQEGDVRFDGISIKDIDINSYRKRIGYVPQDTVLFNMSIRDNMLWAKLEATENEIWQACQLAHADEFIESFADGLDTIVGERGVRLSGGQMQRIALARAFLRKPEILMLDEATSSLDSHSEKLIQEAIDTVSKNTTLIVVAHRLSTIKKADCIYVLDKGEIVEQGSYNELIQKKSVFDAMVKMQELN